MVLPLEKRLISALRRNDQTALSDLPAGYDAYIAGLLAERAFASDKSRVMIILRDDARLKEMQNAISFFHASIRLHIFPAWDCLPYDRVSPAPEIISTRITALAALKKPALKAEIVLTTVNAALQKIPPADFITSRSLQAKSGDTLPMTKLLSFLVANGFNRTDQVTDRGEYTIRGGLIDLWPPAAEKPLRIDFFGDDIDSIRIFDPVDQLTLEKTNSLSLIAASEYGLDDQSIACFRRSYRDTFGPASLNDPLYAAISEGRRYQGAEHWLPFFHDELDTLFSYADNAHILLDHQANEAANERLTLVQDYYSSRREALDLAQDKKSILDTATPYKPTSPDSLFLSHDIWIKLLVANGAKLIVPHDNPMGKAISFGGVAGRNFSTERADASINIYDAVGDHALTLRDSGKRVLFACASAGSRSRLTSVLEDHNLTNIAEQENWSAVQKTPKGLISCITLAVEHGFETEHLAIITEQDVLGDKLVRKSRKTKRADDFLRDATALAAGDLVVHANHGIGRFEGLETVEVSGAPHACLQLSYQGGDKLFVPVENIDVLSRFGSDDSDAKLDKLGGVAWQARKAKLKKRVREIADALMRVAAERALKVGEKLDIPAGIYDEFCSRFPYVETEDQLKAIEDVVADLSSGRPMDRLICGDVGFGKTEVALRAAFLATMAGFQVAIVAPTTLLARQHYATFKNRFRELPVQIGQLSRLVKPKDIKLTKASMAEGTMDIVIGTHALLSKTIAFKHLGLLIVDEEQHFGVNHKEQLKALKADVHVLTLTATPIPRTLQMAMNGIRDLSIIATPPIDRLAVRTYAVPFDGMLLREALLREHYRGGQSFFVVPRIADLADATKFLEEQVPEVKYIVGHGQMSPSTLEEVMTAFYDGQYDVLLSTTIVESGIDIPRANTLVVYRADRFGLAQLYQLRGRVGRSKIRAYAYLTTPAGRVLTDTANRRLGVLQQLDTLGAGFSIASHDLDIRGAGNLIGDQQSGHIREVGVELYQQMLEDAVKAAQTGLNQDYETEDDWSPQINVGASVLIPEQYVSELSQRMALYRRLGGLDTREDVDGFCAELIDRFGPLPVQVKQLAAVIIIKGYAKRAGIEKLDAGQKGVVFHFRDKKFSNPAGLVEFISTRNTVAKLRPDHSLFYQTRMPAMGQRLKTVATLTKSLARIAENQGKSD